MAAVVAEGLATGDTRGWDAGAVAGRGRACAAACITAADAPEATPACPTSPAEEDTVRRGGSATDPLPDPTSPPQLGTPTALVALRPASAAVVGGSYTHISENTVCGVGGVGAACAGA